MKNKKIYFLFLLSIILILFSFASCNIPQIADSQGTTSIKTTATETKPSDTTIIETTVKSETIAIQTTGSTTESVKKDTNTEQPTETTQAVATDTTIVTDKGLLKVHFIDVGQGDSELIQTPEGNTMLIDGGPQSSASSLVSYIKSLGITKINVVVATHPHEDHIGGLVSVLESFEVGNVIDSGVSQTTKIYATYLNLIKSKNINFVNWSLGQKFSIGNGIEFTILGPITKSSSDLNNSSIVIRLTFLN